MDMPSACGEGAARKPIGIVSRQMVVDNVFAGWNFCVSVAYVQNRDMKPGLPREDEVDKVVFDSHEVYSLHIDAEDCGIAAWVLQSVLPSTRFSLSCGPVRLPEKASDTVAFVIGFVCSVLDRLATWNPPRSWITEAECLALAYFGVDAPVSSYWSPRLVASVLRNMSQQEYPEELYGILLYYGSLCDRPVHLVHGQIPDLSLLVSSLELRRQEFGTRHVVGLYILTFASLQHPLVIERLVRDVFDLPFERSVWVFDFLAGRLCMGQNHIYIRIYTQVYFSWLEVVFPFGGAVPEGLELSNHVRRLHGLYHRTESAARPSVRNMISCHHPAKSQWEFCGASRLEDVQAPIADVLCLDDETHRLPVFLLMMKQLCCGADEVLSQIQPLLSRFSVGELETLALSADHRLPVELAGGSAAYDSCVTRFCCLHRQLEDAGRLRP